MSYELETKPDLLTVPEREKKVDVNLKERPEPPEDNPDHLVLDGGEV